MKKIVFASDFVIDMNNYKKSKYWKYWQTSEFEISGFDKFKTWLADTRLKKNCQILSLRLFQLHRFIPIIEVNPV